MMTLKGEQGSFSFVGHVSSIFSSFSRRHHSLFFVDVSYRCCGWFVPNSCARERQKMRHLLYDP